jgi:hypothetical protein
MGILNYTTQISVEKTGAEISKLLSSAGASAIMTEYEDAVLCAIAFRVQGPYGPLSFRLPANIGKIEMVLRRDKNVPARLKTREQASKVAWRIIKDWLEAQLAIIKAEMVTVDQVFLPYSVTHTGETLYERISSNQFKALTESAA